MFFAKNQHVRIPEEMQTFEKVSVRRDLIIAYGAIIYDEKFALAANLKGLDDQVILQVFDTAEQARQAKRKLDYSFQKKC